MPSKYLRKSADWLDNPLNMTKLKLGAGLLLAITLFVMYSEWRIARNNEKLQKAVASTVEAKFTQLANNASQLNGNVVDPKKLAEEVKKSIGAEFLDEIKRSRGEIFSLATALGQIQAEIRNLKTSPVTSNTSFDQATNGFSNAYFEQNRLPKPSLTALNMSYNPKETDPNNRFTAQWINNKEVFNISTVQWKTEDNGLRSAVKLKRTVFNGKDQPLGEEDIPLTNGDFFVPKESLPVERVPSRKTYTFDYYPRSRSMAGAMDYKLNNNLGVRGGILYQPKYDLINRPNVEGFVGISWTPKK